MAQRNEQAAAAAAAGSATGVPPPPRASPPPPARGRRELFRALLAETAGDMPCVTAAMGAAAAGIHLLAAGPTAAGLLAVLGCGATALSAWTVNYFFRTQHFLDRIKSKWRAADEARLAADVDAMSRTLAAAGLGEEAGDLRNLQRLRGELERALEPAVFSFQRDDLASAARAMVVSSLESLRHLLRIEDHRRRFPLDRLERERRDLEKKVSGMPATDPFREPYRKKVDLLGERLGLARSLDARKLEVRVTLERSIHVIEKALLDAPDWSSAEGTKLRECVELFNQHAEMTRRVNDELRGELSPREPLGAV